MIGPLRLARNVVFLSDRVGLFSPWWHGKKDREEDRDNREKKRKQQKSHASEITASLPAVTRVYPLAAIAGCYVHV